MRVTIAQTLQHYEKKNLPKDICAGIIIMAVSIPISMGYAQIAGLPAVYGLYGSVFPILLFALFSTSPQFIFGVDAAPAALIGGALIDLHIESGSEAALKVVPVLTLFVAVWLLAFYLMKAGKLVNYISAPVMGGFITGICTTIILMQVPKLFGGTAGTGELLELAGHIGNTLGQIHVPVSYNGCDCTGNSAGGKETDTKISDGGRTDGGWSPYDKVSSGQGVGHTDIKCCADGTSAVEGGGSVCSAA